MARTKSSDASEAAGQKVSRLLGAEFIISLVVGVVATSVVLGGGYWLSHGISGPTAMPANAVLQPAASSQSGNVNVYLNASGLPLFQTDPKKSIAGEKTVVNVRGYYRKNGKYVAPHVRKMPGEKTISPRPNSDHPPDSR